MQPTLGQAVALRVVELCRENQISLNRLANICGITQSTLNNIVNGGSNNPTLSTIKKVCDGLDMTLVEFFNAEEFLSLDQEIQ